MKLLSIQGDLPKSRAQQMSKTEKAKYIEIFDDIVESIRSRKLSRGDKVLSENEIIRAYNVSNTTAKRALMELEILGWAKKIRGKGTIALDGNLSKRLIRDVTSQMAIRGSFKNNIRRDGLEYKSKSFRELLPRSPLISIGSENFQIASDVVKIKILRFADGILIKDEVRYVNLKLCPDIMLLDDIDPIMSVYENKYKIEVESAKRSITTSVLNPSDGVFKNKTPISIFNLKAATLSRSGEIVELEDSRYRGEKYEFLATVNFADSH